MSITGMFSSIGKAVNTGLSVGLGRGFKIGGFGTMAATAGIGAAAGIGLSAMSDGSTDPAVAGATGAAIGAAALPAAGFAAGAFGSAAVGVAKMTPGMAMGVGQAASAASPFIAAAGVQAATKVGSSIWNVGKRMIDWDDGADAFNKVKFTGPISGAKAGWKNSKGIHKKIANSASGVIMNGKVMMGGVALAEGMKKAFNTVQTAKMGQMVGTDTMTPRVPSYSDNAGATGDLVFALNANRRG